MRNNMLDTTQHRYMRQGFVRGLIALKKFAKDIEYTERNASRRYKLLKATFDWCLENANYVVEAVEIKSFKYKFDKGQITIVEDETNNGMGGDVRFKFWKKSLNDYER